jgi:iron complex outermembrane receptor protein
MKRSWLAWPLCCLVCAPAPLRADEDVPGREPVVVTATRISEDAARVPAAVTVIGGAELRDRGATDLRGALALCAGVDIAPGGDGGPASAIPAFWGMREIDAFLLVVDGVPWGGAFNPALSALSLDDVERIEVLRGAAPVMYGAASFVGVIHVIHRDPSKAERRVRASAGSYDSRGLSLTQPLSELGGMKSALALEAERQGFRDPRTKYDRSRLDWRAEKATSLGTLKFGADAVLLRQNPASPILREGTALTGILDANHNPVDAFLNEDRLTASAGLDRDLAAGKWSTLVSYSHSAQNILRGFLADVAADPNAHGFRENIGITDLYFDSHAQLFPADSLKFVVGADHLHGRGSARGGDFDYNVSLDGSAAPGGGQLPSQADVRITDQRDFSGLYGFVEWSPRAFILELGARLNRMEETRRTSNRDLASGALTQGSDVRSLWHGAGSAAATWKAWESGRDLLNFFVSYRNAFKPAAMDFGLDSQANVLNPETSQSYEAGAKSRWLEDRVSLNVSGFQMDSRNLLVPVTVGGLPAFANGGTIRSRGLEVEATAKLLDALSLRGAYSLHDIRFRDYVQDFGGTPTQLAGNRFEMAPRDSAAAGLTYAPGRGFTATAQASYAGSRFLDKRNRALAKEYATWSAGIGWRGGAWEVRCDARNINDQRAPLAESELGDAQYYLLAARRLDVTTSWKF